MTSFQIKVIAIITMIIDHVGLFLLPQFPVLRMIGRLSFPFFAWLIANGANHTRNINHYLARLLVFAIISQIPYILVYRQIIPEFWRLNILFTLSLGLTGIILIKQTTNKFIRTIIIVLCAVAAYYTHVEYEIMGVLSIISFYLFFHQPFALIASQTFIYFSELTLYPLNVLSIKAWQTLVQSHYIQPLALLSLIIINFYNQKQGTKLKYLFYIVYPTQFMIIYLLKTIV